eukprot:6771682-Heterocapsa_arctica.AAC.1
MPGLARWGVFLRPDVGIHPPLVVAHSLVHRDRPVRVQLVDGPEARRVDAAEEQLATLRDDQDPALVH